MKYINPNQNENIAQFKSCCLENFPFLVADFDSLTEYQIICKIVEKLNEIVKFANNELSQQLTDYINKYFNDIMMNAIYEENTETIKFYMKEGIK